MLAADLVSAEEKENLLLAVISSDYINQTRQTNTHMPPWYAHSCVNWPAHSGDRCMQSAKQQLNSYLYLFQSQRC